MNMAMATVDDAPVATEKGVVCELIFIKIVVQIK